jgi:hypothetical protein
VCLGLQLRSDRNYPSWNRKHKEIVMLFMRAIKWGVLSLATLGVAGGAIFGSDLGSYFSSSARSVRSAVKDSVPMEFQLRRAHDLLDDVIPEMHANVRLVAQQGVEIDSLRADIDQSGKNLIDQNARIQKLRDALATSDSSFTFGRITYSRDQVKEDLANRLETVKEAQVILEGKQRLLENRQKSLAALDRTRSQKALLESQIAALEGQYRLLQASSAGTSVQIDSSKLAQAERLIAQIKNKLDTSERVLAYEGKFTDPVRVDIVSERDVMAQADDYLASAKK